MTIEAADGAFADLNERRAKLEMPHQIALLHSVTGH